MTHSEMEDLYELYLLGDLEFAQSAEISDHLGRECSVCLDGLRNAAKVIDSLSSMVELTPPPPALKERILALAAPPKPKPSQWPMAFALACAASLALVVWGLNERQNLQELMRQRNELRATLAILSEADTKTVSFGQEAKPDPQGRVFISSAGGVVFLGTRLPALESGKTFEFWLVPTKGTPQPAGLFKTNSEGIAVNVLAQSISPANYAAIAVSIEPTGGSAQPTSKPILIVPLG